MLVQGAFCIFTAKRSTDFAGPCNCIQRSVNSSTLSSKSPSLSRVVKRVQASTAPSCKAWIKALFFCHFRTLGHKWSNLLKFWPAKILTGSLVHKKIDVRNLLGWNSAEGKKNMDMKIGLLALRIVRSLATRYSTYYTIL